MDIKQTLIDFSTKIGVSGIEGEASAYGKNLLAKYGEVSVTPLGSLVCTVNKGEENKPHIMLMAHMDEIGLIVTNICEDGFIKVSNVGGVDRNTLLSSTVTIHGTKAIKGIVCSTPPHLQKGSQKELPKVEDIYIDTGYSFEEVSKLVSLGDRATLNAKTEPMLNNFLTGKALDDRAGCVSLLECLEILKQEKLNCSLTVVFSSMEEIGCQGAVSATAFVKPTHAIAVDVSFAYTPDNKPHLCGKISMGPMIGFAPILNHQISKELVELAKQKEIPYQCEVMSGRTGTDADEIAVSGIGVKTALISIPLKYMHTSIETIDIDDVKNTGKLMAEYIKTLGKQE